MCKTSRANKSNEESASQDYSIMTNNDGNNKQDESKDRQNNHRERVQEKKPQPTIFKNVLYIALWFLVTYVSKAFSKFLCIHQSQAGKLAFIPANYQYDDEYTYFDNTFLTYGTDFMICAMMLFASYKCYSTHVALGYKGCALFGSYAISVFSGGYAHITFLTIDSLNTFTFRLWWIFCVGTVTAAGGFMGMCGSEIISYFRSSTSNERRFRIGLTVPDSLWWIYGGFMTIMCIIGEISYKRPACDIFVAGTTQFLPTVCCALSLLSIRWNDAIPLVEGSLSGSSTPTETTSALSRKVRVCFYVGFLGNAPLLAIYPFLVQYTNLPLGVVNALLHSNLTMAWGLQAWSVYQVSLMMKAAQMGKKSL